MIVQGREAPAVQFRFYYVNLNWSNTEFFQPNRLDQLDLGTLYRDIQLDHG